MLDQWDAVQVQERPRTDCDADAFATALSDSCGHARLSTIAARVARRRYGIRAGDADDVFQESALTYLLVRPRYARDANHFGLFFGIFHRTALKFLSSARGRAAKLERLGARLAHERRAPDESSSPAASTLRAERDAAIRDSVAALSEGARGPLLDLASGCVRRLDLVARLGVNRNTFDSRLRTARRKLRRELARRGEA